MMTIILLYAAEGLPAGIFHDLVAVWLLEAHDISLGSLGLVSLLALPWTLKALWSPLVDRSSVDFECLGRRGADHARPALASDGHARLGNARAAHDCIRYGGCGH